jgi:Protein of unknown function (DUF2752)
MRLFLKKRAPDQIEFGLLYGGIALAVLGVGRLHQVLRLTPDCVFKGLTGIPCPTCGSTRAVVQLSHGDFLSAFVMNPLATLCLMSAVLFFFYSLMSAVFALPRVCFFFTNKEKNIMRVGVVMLLFLQWTYLILLL